MAGPLPAERQGSDARGDALPRVRRPSAGLAGRHGCAPRTVGQGARRLRQHAAHDRRPAGCGGRLRCDRVPRRRQLVRTGTRRAVRGRRRRRQGRLRHRDALVGTRRRIGDGRAHRRGSRRLARRHQLLLPAARRVPHHPALEPDATPDGHVVRPILPGLTARRGPDRARHQPEDRVLPVHLGERVPGDRRAAAAVCERRPAGEGTGRLVQEAHGPRPRARAAPDGVRGAQYA